MGTLTVAVTLKVSERTLAVETVTVAVRTLNPWEPDILCGIYDSHSGKLGNPALRNVTNGTIKATVSNGNRNHGKVSYDDITHHHGILNDKYNSLNGKSL